MWHKLQPAQIFLTSVSRYLEFSISYLTTGATRVTLGSLTVLLLTWVPTWATLRGTLLLLLLAAILLALWWITSRLLSITLLRRRAILTLTLTLGCTVLAWWRSAVLAALRWTAVLLLLAVTLLRSATVLTAGWSAVAARRRVGLLVLGVVGAVDGAEEEFDDPEVGGEVDWGVGAGHLFLLVLIV
jgi:hypothetical protein